MEIKLNDQDFEKLANMLVDKVAQRLLVAIRQELIWDAAKESAKNLVDRYMGNHGVPILIGSEVERVIKSESGEFLKDVINKTIHEVMQDDTFTKTVSEKLYKAELDRLDRQRKALERDMLDAYE